jgi:hypothetical protein
MLGIVASSSFLNPNLIEDQDDVILCFAHI